MVRRSPHWKSTRVLERWMSEIRGFGGRPESTWGINWLLCGNHGHVVIADTDISKRGHLVLHRDVVGFTRNERRLLRSVAC